MRVFSCRDIPMLRLMGRTLARQDSNSSLPAAPENRQNSFLCIQQLQTHPPRRPTKTHIQSCFSKVSLFSQRRHKHRLSYSLRRIRNKKRESAKVFFYTIIFQDGRQMNKKMFLLHNFLPFQFSRFLPCPKS